MAGFIDEMGNNSDQTNWYGSDDTSHDTPTPTQQFATQSQQEVVSGGGSNVLNGYRSVTYNFTLAALDNTDLTNPESYRNSELKFVILKSGGKGTAGLSASPTEQAARLAAGSENSDPRDRVVQRSAQTAINYNTDLVDGFNKDSPGRFDMFINDVTIETIMTTNETSNSTLPTKIKFEVMEPYSINGFIEALHVAAIAAGYTSYLDACFLLKMEFWGYPDSGDFSEPVLIKNSERYFPFGLTEINVDVTENGTRYQCGAVPYNERAFGQTNIIKKPIKMEGETVKEILDNLFKNINIQVKESDDKSKDTKPTGYDTYVIQFPSKAPTGELIDTVNKKIADKKLTELLKDNALYGMAEPGDTAKPNAYQADAANKPTADEQAKKPESIKYVPGKTVVNFPQNMNINDAISSVVRDSDYVKDLLKEIGKKADSPDQYGFIEYFIIKLQIANKPEKNEATKKNYQIFTYQVIPYKVHYTRIPGYAQSTIKEETLKKVSNRTYNYIYTGQNIDVLSFKLNFNTLFFEAVPTEMGNKDTVASKTAAAPGNNVEVKNKPSDSNLDAKDRRLMNQVPQSPVKTVSTPMVAYNGGNASQPKDDPYSVMARHMHNSVINSKASMITGEMEILGDPFYVATGGVGNYNPKSGAMGATEKDEADHTSGSTLITINFRNPVDFNKFEDGGMMQFDGNRVPFSGVYQVLNAVSTFKDGIFKQKLDIMRMPGQVLDSNLRESDPADKRVTVPDRTDAVVVDNTRSVAPTQRADSATVMDQLDRGLPSPGLPGEASNFTNATGGLGGNTPTLLNQTAGQLPTIAQGSSIVGQPVLNANDALSNVRLQSSGLVNLSQQSLGSSSLIAVASNVLTGNLPIQRAAGILGGALANSAISSALKISNIGSGIGKGATVSIDPSVPAAPTMNEIKQGFNISPIALPAGSVGNINSAINSNNVNAATSLGSNANSLVGGIGDKINALTASTSDPQSIGAKVGLNISGLSGLGGALQSKMPAQVTGMVNNIPSDVNLTQASSAGLVLDYIPASKIQNIPATAPYATAPVPQADLAYAKEVAKRGITALENLYGVNSPSKLSTNLVPKELIDTANQNVSNARLNPFGNVSGLSNPVDLSVASDKLNSAQSQLSGLTGQPNIPDLGVAGSALSKFGSPGPSPLDKLVNKLNDPNAAPYTGSDPIIRSRLGLPPI